MIILRHDNDTELDTSESSEFRKHFKLTANQISFDKNRQKQLEVIEKKVNLCSLE